MAYVYVAFVEFNKEVGRTDSMQEAARRMVSEAKLLVDRIGAQVAGTCWIETFLVHEEWAQRALEPDYDLRQQQSMGITFFNDVIVNAHEKGWMVKGRWVAEAAVS